MPIVIPKDIPAFKTLEEENIFIMEKLRAKTQDIRPIEIIILNLMPTKIETETQLLRLLSNTPLQVNITFLKTSTYESKNTSKNHLDKFYKEFDKIKNKKFDGMIITGAPVETLEFEEVDYFEELKEIMDYANENVTSTIFICWGAQAALYHHYKIQKHRLNKKVFGVFEHRKIIKFETLLNGIDDLFYIPHSRHTEIKSEDILSNQDLVPLVYSEDAGYSIIKSKDNSKIFITGHMEYDKYTLEKEYQRDLSKNLDIDKPVNYYDENDKVVVKWRSSANILFSNWLNYYVYQVTPYKRNNINKKI